ncbi:ABC transporter ATP-binding protein [Stackebrandtia soli]|uniref:ABC transporter ATP-binding protein n=1 Tax=Stackebrandtia soli TaxID=1892856 RepID=UPI0039ECAA65
MSTVEFRDFTWRHAGRRDPAVTDVKLRIDHGERVLLLGASGAGKSTVLAAMAGLLAEDSGEQTGHVLVDGADARAARDHIGILFQDPQTQLVMSRCGDDVAFGLENRSVPTEAIWPRVRGALADVGFRYPLDHPTHALSGGEQQRLALAGVLAARPGLLLLDEPTANLDPDGADTIMDGLRRATADRDTTLVIVEHRVALALPLVDRVIALAPGGAILADGPPSTVFADDSLAGHGIWTPSTTMTPRRAVAIGPPALTGAGLGLRYPGAATPALADVDITLHSGTVTCVEGGNGSGKSTLAHVLGGLVAPTTGTVTLTGTTTAPHRLRAARLAARIGSVFQNPEHQFVTNSVWDELAFGPRAAKLPTMEIERRVGDLLDRLRLGRLAKANPFTLSGGEARRLSVATVLANSPDILILDEPTFGQDRRTWDELIDLLAGLRDDGAAILAVTHDPLVVEALADTRLRLDGGSAC